MMMGMVLLLHTCVGHSRRGPSPAVMMLLVINMHMRRRAPSFYGLLLHLTHMQLLLGLLLLRMLQGLAGVMGALITMKGASMVRRSRRAIP